MPKWAVGLLLSPKRQLHSPFGRDLALDKARPVIGCRNLISTTSDSPVLLTVISFWYRRLFDFPLFLFQFQFLFPLSTCFYPAIVRAFPRVPPLLITDK